MKIGELSRATATPAETIRFYQREGLLPETARTEGNYRIYGPEHVERLTFVRHCRSLDMALDEIRQLLSFKDSPEENCAGVNELLDDHIGHVAQRIRELSALEEQLRMLRDQCGGVTGTTECGILKSLTEGAPPSASKRKKPRHVHGTHA
ncbi:MAG: Cd(II)/Pb(II)-responsive transcriptional regulator [Gammaproteobacteria bacterium]|nr:Cd(II)/Pb(II)-responsive transcriptional regulator [Gammaproteobacteria bacterium]MBU1442685.1 Cd(II)/Pb(II)-responsive transcriptional regulator [Gammaproteobacteria bacterium]MBU2284880.1 Cd(II)/Pb(II)-responsive transcriptional regulator [Gammaproteobacteria bacterium]MBU2409498.1 Cd(II)/Pb(II)-responsive transcriptional regulator [Gammaproteobacteria bacterium]